MKKSYILFMVLLFMLGISATAVGAPLPGTWNKDKLGTPELQGLTDPGIFKGLSGFTDPEIDGASLGDSHRGRDSSSLSGTFAPYYWETSGMVRDTMIIGDFVNLGGGIGTRTFKDTREGGVFQIWGDHLWGQAPGTTYTAAIQGGGTSGTIGYKWDGLQWNRDSYTTTVHYWGAFNADPFLFDFKADETGGRWFDASAYGQGWMVVRDLDNVEFQIKSVPIPAAVWLLGSGLAGLIGLRKKFAR